MAITRAQYLQGNAAQGVVLAGQVQGVKQGAGTTIASDGTISVNAATTTGLVKLNNLSAYNNYVWPSAVGDPKSFLTVDQTGNLSWQFPSVSPTVHVDDFPPANPEVGQLWFDCTQGILKVYEDCDGIAQWTPGNQGKQVLPNNVSGDPAFTDGDGSLLQPYVVESETTNSGGVIQMRTTITITGLAPYQFVPIFDANGETNEYRFTVTNQYADGSGNLSFRIVFTDKPNSLPNQAYTAQFSAGAVSPVYIVATVGIVAPVSLLSTGSITGTPNVGQNLQYSQGFATGGQPPYVYSWNWRRESDNSILQTNGEFYQLTSADVGQRVYVELIATDSSLNSAFGNTSVYPASPVTIERGAFPLTDIAYPTTIPGTASTAWGDAGTNLEASGCIEFTVDGVTWGQGSRPISNGGTITTRWLTTAGCGASPNGSTLVGTIFNASSQDSGSITLDQIPSPFTFTPVASIIPGQIATSNTITPNGYNDTAFITYNGGLSTGTTIQASVGGGAWTTVPLYNSPQAADLPINPGQTLAVRFTTGSTFEASYNATINIGVGSTVQSGVFTATNSPASTFTTLIVAPTTTIDEPASPSWADGTTTISATGCLEFKVGTGGTWGQSATSITTGNVLYTRWKDTSTCGQSAHGTTIVGTITNGTKIFNASLTIDRVPAAFSFADVVNQAVSSTITSSSITITGFNAPVYVTKGTSTLSSLEINVGNTSWVSIPSSGTAVQINPVTSGGVSIAIRGGTGSSVNTTYTGVINIGQGTSISTDTWDVQTTGNVPTVLQPTAVSPVNGATNLNPNANTPSGITLTASAYSAINGAGAQLSSDWEVRASSTGGAIVVNTTSTTSLTSYFVPVASLSVNTTYFWRVRYRSNDGSPVVSDWGNWVSFTTAPSFSLYWTLRNSFNQSFNGANDGKNIVWSDSQGFLACGTNGRTYGSTTGLTWTQKTSLPNTNNCTGLIWDGSKFVAVTSNNNAVYTSANAGVTWSTVNTNGLNSPRDIAFNGSIYVTGSNNNNYVYTSTNLTNWTARLVTNNAGEFRNLNWCYDRFIAVTNNRYVAKSFDGITWTWQQLSTNDDLRQPIYHNGYYYIGVNNNNAIWRSSDASTWTRITTPSRSQWLGGGGQFLVATGDTKQIMSSTTNGTSFSLDAIGGGTSLTAQGEGVAYSPSLNRFVVVSDNSSFYSTP